MPSFDAGQTGITPGVTITRPDTTEYAARTTVGFTEVPAGSGSFDFAHPDPGTLLKFSFDALIGGVTYYASVWDDGLTPQAAAQAAIVAEDVATATALAEVDTAITSIPASVDIRLGETHGVGSWESNLPPTGALVTQLSVGDDGLPLGRIMPYGTISVYLGAELHYRLDEIADADGDFVLTLPYGSTWTLVAENPPNYRSTTAVITIPPLP